MDTKTGAPKSECPVNELSFLDPALISDPFRAYEKLRDEQPIAFDASMGMYVVTRHADVRAVFADPQTYSNADRDAKAFKAAASERVARNQKRFQSEGWLYEPNVGYMDDPLHRDVRRIFDRALGAQKVKTMEADIAFIADELLSAIRLGQVHEIVHELAEPLPMMVIFKQVGVRREDMSMIKKWCDHLFKRMSFMESEEDEQESITQEIKAQHYFMNVIRQLRSHPDDTILGELVNTPIGEGRTMSDGEALSSVLHTVFVAGSETTTFAIASAVKILCDQQELFSRLKNGGDRDIRQFIEEVLRLECPAVTVFRVASRDVQLHGVDIPQGSVLALKLGAANRDERHFACPERLNLDRANVRSHVAFGHGIHSCAGASLARTELYILFKKILDRYTGVHMAFPDRPVEYRPHVVFRAIDKLHVEFHD